MLQAIRAEGEAALAETLRDQINAALTQVAVLDNCLHELRNEMPAAPELQIRIARHVHWIFELLERETEELRMFLLSAGSCMDAQQPEELRR